MEGVSPAANTPVARARGQQRALPTAPWSTWHAEGSCKWPVDTPALQPSLPGRRHGSGLELRVTLFPGPQGMCPLSHPLPAHWTGPAYPAFGLAGCYNKVPQPEGRKQHSCVTSRFWRPGGSRGVPSEGHEGECVAASLLGLYMAPRVHLAFVCMRVCVRTCPFYEDTSPVGIRGHPNDLALTGLPL